MAFSFWNNPIIVSAFRVRQRRSGVFFIISLYLGLLVVVAAALPETNMAPWHDSWPLTYLVSMVSWQCVLSGLMSLASTWNSMRTEVVQRTLDFQRVALAPRDIVVGKMFGPPTMAYLLALATL